MSSIPAVHFFYEVPVSLKQRGVLKEYIASIFKKEGFKLNSLNYIFCSDDRLLEINKQFLHHDYYTDIITFELSDPQNPVEGEIYISVDRVKDNSRLIRESFIQEIHRVIFHGALHLCGYSDKTHKQRGVMREKEDFYLRGYMQRST